MSTISYISGRSADTIVHVPYGALMRWWAAYTTWRIERLAIDRLEAMSDRQLKDIGLVRSQIALAVRRGRERSTDAAATPQR